MSWEARTNTGSMRNGAVFAVLESPQEAGHTHPQPGTSISVYLTMSEAPIASTVSHATAFTMQWDLKDGTSWHLVPYRQAANGSQPPVPAGMTATYWMVLP